MSHLSNIKIIRTNTRAIKDNKTLLWASQQDVTVANWSRWQGFVTSISDFLKWRNNIRLIGVILLDINESDISFIEKNARDMRNLYLDYSALKIRPVEFWKNLDAGILFLNSLEQEYQQIRPSWNGTAEDAIACLAQLYRFQRIVDWHGSEERTATLKNLNITVEVGAQPPQVYFITQYFVHKNSKRAREISRCLMYNCSNKHIDKILLLTEDDYTREWAPIRGSSKIEQHIIGKRLTYADLLKATMDIVPKNTIVVYANADIYLNDTIHHIFDVNMKDKMFALLRWDVDSMGENAKLFGPRADSQDTWIVLSDSVKERNMKLDVFDYQLGRAGCDNRFTCDMFSNRFLICNPCNTIQTLHMHTTNLRDYNPYDAVPAKFYLHVNPSSLLDIRQVEEPDNRIGTITYGDFPIKIQCPNKQNGTTWCTMVGRHERFVWECDKDVVYRGCSLPIFNIKKGFVNAWNTIYDLQNIYVGKNLESFLKNSDMNFSIQFTESCHYVSQMASVPVRNKIMMQHIDLYCIHYLSKILQLLNKYPNLSFWMPAQFEKTVASLCSTDSLLHAISWRDNLTIHADEVIGFVATPREISSEDISALRESFEGWNENVNSKNCVILTDNTYLNTMFIERVKEIVGKEWTVKTLDIGNIGVDAYEELTDCAMCLFFGGPNMQTTWSKLWALPKNCKVIEFQNELKTDGEFQHMAGACGFDSWIITVHKGSVDDMRNQMLNHFTTWTSSTLFV